ncbi:MAG: hypothetical protein AAB263_04870, partial [Planctomycetota bacterium]
MFALVFAPSVGVLAGEAPTPPPADPSLEAYVKEREAHQAGNRQAAEFHYVKGMRARDENRLIDAVRELTLAVDYAPDNETYAKDLKAVRALAGLERDTRSKQIDRLVDEFQVKQQELWNEAQAKKNDGITAMQAGDFNLADRSFQMSLVRLEGLSPQDDRRTAAIQEVEKLAADVRTRREARDRDDAAARNRTAQEEQLALRAMGIQLERERIDAMLRRALAARGRRDYDEAILITEQVLKVNRADERAVELLTKCRRERHVYIRQMTADRWDEEHRLLSEQIRKNMLPQLELVRYTSDWPEIDKLRSAPIQGIGGVNAAEQVWRKSIADKLEQEITVDFQDQGIDEVVNTLRRLTGTNLVLDPRVVATPTPVTLPATGMKFKFVLENIKLQTKLSYSLRNEAIYISSDQGSRGDMVMRMYDIRDLTHGMTNFPGPDLTIPAAGATGTTILPPTEAPPKAETTEFIDIIKQSVAPATWTAADAGTSIEEYNGSMVVNQTMEVHAQIDELLASLRNQRGAQIHVKCKFLSVENSMLEQIGISWQNYGGAIPLPPAPYVAGGVGSVGNSNVGAVWGNPGTGSGIPGNILAAGAINNQLLGYTGGLTLPAPGANDGIQLQSQMWQLGSNFWASAILTAVEKERRGNVIFEPDITMFSGQRAHIVSMHQQSYISDYNIVQNQYEPVVSVLSYGTVLDVQA